MPAMRIFEFRPIKGTEGHPDWKLSDYCGPCRVVAEDEKSARGFAANEFANDVPRGWSVQSPWHNPDLVKAIFVISGASQLPPVGTVMMPSEGYPGYSVGRKARRRMRRTDDGEELP
jgi:hypothetical protein